LRLVKDLFGEAEFDELASAHDGDARCDLGYDWQAVGDKNVGKSEFALEFLQQEKDLRADGDVESGNRFVGDDELGLEDQRARDADALALATGKFVGIALHGFLGEADAAKNCGGARKALLCVESWFMNGKRFGNDFADAHARVQRGVGILEDHLRLPARGAQFRSAEREQVAPFELDFATVRLGEPEEHARESSLAAAAFADDSEGLAARDIETHAIHGREARALGFLGEDTSAAAVGLAQFADCKKIFH
jgi:hypothetical protein